jgi:hypothetical protein
MIPSITSRAALGLSAFLLFTASTEAVRADQEPLEIRFVPPDFDAHYSLAVFNEQMEIVRTLHRGSTLDDFAKGNDALITSWDRMDEAGNPAPPGRYLIRGHAVPALEIEGVAYHFNDWMETPDSPGVKGVLDLSFPSSEALLVLARLFDGTHILMRLTDQETKVLPVDLSGLDPHLLASEANTLVLASANKIRIHDLSNPSASPIEIEASTPISAIAIRDGAIVWDERGTYKKWMQGKLDTLAAGWKDRTVSGLAWLSGRLITVAGNAVLVQSADAVEEFSFPGLEHIIEVEADSHGKLWLLDTGTTAAGLKEISATGEPLRWIPAPDEPFTTRSFAVSPEGRNIALLEASAGVNRLRWLRLKESGSNQDSDEWMEVFSRTVTDCTEFGIEKGQLVAKTQAELPAHARLRLAPNPLEPQAKHIMDVTARIVPDGSILSTQHGLELARISHAKGLKRIALLRPSPESDLLQVFQSDGTVVEEFSIRGLHRAAAIDCGDYTITNAHE